ncbi:MAG: efflux RND transporter permease subunit, partial [Armatimonadetes bacterium]|nr:efflux RND transporter permease subunit [Armatimonadota bacterium]
MDIFSFSVRRPVSVSVLALAVLVLGLVFSGQINIEAWPKIDIPVISVAIAYPGGGPPEMEEQVSRPVEEALGALPNLKKISSTSMEGLSITVIEFQYGVRMDEAASNVREKLDAIKGTLPPGIRPPLVTTADPAASPVVRLALTGGEDLRALRTIAEDDLKPLLERIEGTANVEVTGGEERAILVQVDEGRLRALGVPVQQIMQSLQSENLNIPAGRITAS